MRFPAGSVVSAAQFVMALVSISFLSVETRTGSFATLKPRAGIFSNGVST